MIPSEIQNRVINIIAEMAEIDPSQLESSSTLNDFAVSSITQLEIMFAIEEEFDIYLPDEADELNLLGLAKNVQKLLSEKEDNDTPSSRAN